MTTHRRKRCAIQAICIANYMIFMAADNRNQPGLNQQVYPFYPEMQKHENSTGKRAEKGSIL